MNIKSCGTYSKAIGKEQLAQINDTLKKGGVAEYSYANVSFEEFSKHYSSEGLLKRKIVSAFPAFPMALIYAVYHLVRRLFQRMNKDLDFYYAKRALQFSWGSLVILVNDKYGLYVTQKALFHLDCYDKLIEARAEAKSWESFVLNLCNLWSPQKSSVENYQEEYQRQQNDNGKASVIFRITEDVTLTSEQKFNLLIKIAKDNGVNMSDKGGASMHLKQVWKNAGNIFSDEQAIELAKAIRRI